MVQRCLIAVIALLRRPWIVVDRAKWLVAQYGIKSLEGIEQTAEQLGFPIEYVDLPLKVSGFVFRMDDGSPVIAINRRRSPLHQRYTIAHELGHCLFHLHAPKLVSDRHADLEADCFAFVCLALSVPNEYEMAPFALQNLNIAWRVLPVVIYAQTADFLNRLADRLSCWFLPPNPQGA